MTAVYVGLGSNIRPRVHVPMALATLEQRFGVLRVSPVYRCPAVGFDGDDFINLVVGFDSHSDNNSGAHAVQDHLREIEVACGRDRRQKYAARGIDIDLLLYGDAVIDDDTLSLPRADILAYAFVLRPLSELIPNARHPVDGRTYAALWQVFDDKKQPLTPIRIDRDTT